MPTTSAAPPAVSATPPVRLAQVTPARLSLFGRCPLAYRMTYLDRPAPAPGPAWAHLSLGAAVHTALSRFWDLVGPSRRPEAGRELLAQSWSDEGFRDPAQSARWRDRATGWVVDYLAGPGMPAAEPVGVERTVALRTATMALSGRADRIDERGAELVVVDYKTGRSPSTRDEARTSVALAIYAAAAEATLHRPCSSVELHHLPTGVVVGHRFEPGARDRHLRRVESLVEDIGAAERSGDFPATPGQFCSWCDLRAHCPVGRAAAPDLRPWDLLGEPP